MAKIPVVNQEECVGCGDCVEICPDVFPLNDNDVAQVHDPKGGTEEDIQEAIDSCPVGVYQLGRCINGLVIH